MKLIPLLAITVAAYGQTTGQVCWTPDKATAAKTVCMDVPPAAKRAVADWMATQTEGEPAAPKYAGAADLIFSHIRHLIDECVRQFPPANIAADKAAAATATASADSKQAALLPREKVEDPK